MSYSSDKAAYNAAINTDITVQTGPNTIPPEVVGAGYTDLADLLEPYINSINNNALLFGTGVPSNGLGADLDIYYQQSNPINIYRKVSGVWVLQGSLPIDFTLPEGNLTVRTTISGAVVTATKGGWVIANTVYQKATQTQMTIDPADLNFGRIDNIYADTTSNIIYQVGIAQSSPVAPTLPASTILIDQVIVPASSSGDDPYLLFGGGDPTSAAVNININGDTQDLSADREWRVAQADTGVLNFGGLTYNSASTINIGLVQGYVVDNETDPLNPTWVYVNYAGETNKTVTTVGSGIGSYVMLASDGLGGGTISFQNTFPTSSERKTKIYLGKIGHPGGVISAAAVIDEPDYILSPMVLTRDAIQSLGGYVNRGVYPYANGANLNVNITTGSIFGNGINFVGGLTFRRNPNNITTGPFTPVTFSYRTQTGLGANSVTVVDPVNYDLAGVITAIGGAATRATNQWVWCIPGRGFIIQYGQVIYNTITEAIAGVGRESNFVVYPNLIDNAILVGVISVTRAATALNNTSQAQFFRADKLGQILGATAGVSTGTMQQGYNNSLQPQITVTDVLGSIVYKNARALDTSNVFEIQNIAGTTTLSFTGNGGIFSSGSLSAVAGIARANYFTPTLTATANGDNLIALEIAPIGVTGGFTGIGLTALRLRGSASFFGTVQNQAVFGTIGASGKIGFARATDGNAVTTIGYSTISENSAFEINATGGGASLSFSIGTKSGQFMPTTGNFILQNGGTFTDNGFRLEVVGSTRVTGDMIVGINTTTAPVLVINGIAGSSRDIRLQTAGVNRWVIRGNAVAESGTNAGSDFEISNRDDAGTIIGGNPALSIKRSNGTVMMGTTTDDSVSKLIVNGMVASTALKNVNLTDSQVASFVGNASTHYGFVNTTGSINFPSELGSGLAVDRIADYSTTPAIGSFKLWTTSGNATDWYLRKLTLASTWSNWFKIIHDGNIGTFGIQNQNTANQVANYRILGKGSIVIGGGIASPEVNRFNVYGGDSGPATTGSAESGALRVGNGTSISTVLDMGNTSTNSWSWIQSRDGGDYSVQRELRLNPNGGQVTIGSSNNTSNQELRVTTNSTTQFSDAFINLVNNAPLPASRTVQIGLENNAAGGGGDSTFFIKNSNSGGTAFNIISVTISTTGNTNIQAAGSIVLKPNVLAAGATDLIRINSTKLGPDSNGVFDLGSSTQNWKDIYANGTTIRFTGLPTNATTDFDVTVDASGNLRKSSATIANTFILNQAVSPQTSASAWVDNIRIGGSTAANYAILAQTSNVQLSLTGVNYSMSITGFSQITNAVQWIQGSGVIMANAASGVSQNSFTLNFRSTTSASAVQTITIYSVGGDTKILTMDSLVRANGYNLNALNTPPASAADTGTTGEIRWANGFVYLCVAANTWQRSALATW